LNFDYKNVKNYLTKIIILKYINNYFVIKPHLRIDTLKEVLIVKNQLKKL